MDKNIDRRKFIKLALFGLGISSIITIVHFLENISAMLIGHSIDNAVTFKKFLQEILSDKPAITEVVYRNFVDLILNSENSKAENIRTQFSRYHSGRLTSPFTRNEILTEAKEALIHNQSLNNAILFIFSNKYKESNNFYGNILNIEFSVGHNNGAGIDETISIILIEMIDENTPSRAYNIYLNKNTTDGKVKFSLSAQEFNGYLNRQERVDADKKIPVQFPGDTDTAMNFAFKEVDDLTEEGLQKILDYVETILS